MFNLIAALTYLPTGKHSVLLYFSKDSDKVFKIQKL